MGFSTEEIQAALKRMEEGPTSKDDGLTMLCCCYNHGMLRVKGDDGDASQVLRYCMVDKSERKWDVFTIIEPDCDPVYKTRLYESAEVQPKNLKEGWEEGLAKAS